MLETACALMIVASLPPHFWAEVVSTSTYLINLQSSAALHGGIPLERLFARSPDYLVLCSFSCVCYVLLAPPERTKLTAQSVECAFSARVMSTRLSVLGPYWSSDAHIS
jgi:hypothetical protein